MQCVCKSGRICSSKNANCSSAAAVSRPESEQKKRPYATKHIRCVRNSLWTSRRTKKQINIIQEPKRRAVAGDPRAKGSRRKVVMESTATTVSNYYNPFLQTGQRRLRPEASDKALYTHSRFSSTTPCARDSINRFGILQFGLRLPAMRDRDFTRCRSLRPHQVARHHAFFRSSS